MTTKRRRPTLKALLPRTDRAHDWFNFLKETQKDSDRGCALLFGAILDVQVEKLLRSVLLQQKGVVDPLFTYPGPLSSFSAKVRMAYSLRLLHHYEYRDLRRIIKIRNRFAHELHGVSFAKDPEIATLCQELESRKVHGLATANISNRWLFWLISASIVSDIDNRTLDQDTDERIPAHTVFEMAEDTDNDK